MIIIRIIGQIKIRGFAFGLCRRRKKPKAPNPDSQYKKNKYKKRCYFSSHNIFIITQNINFKKYLYILFITSKVSWAHFSQLNFFTLSDPFLINSSLSFSSVTTEEIARAISFLSMGLKYKIAFFPIS